MTALPSAASFTGSTVTEAQFKTSITGMHDYLASLFGTDGAAATALAALGAMGANVAAKSATYTVIATDNGSILQCSGTWTLNLTAAATLGNKFMVFIANSGSGIITIDPNAGEQINGTATYALGVNQAVLLLCTGSGWLVVGGASSPRGIQKFTANGTWTSPAGVTTCWLTLMGGGGGSSGGAVSYGANGGGGGGFINRVQYTCAANTAYAVTIGAGGAGGASTTGTAGSTGGTTSVGALASVAGGAGGGATATAGLGGAGGPGNQSGMGGCAYLAGNGGGVGGGTAGGGAGTAGTAGQANTGGGGGGPFNINIIGNAGGSGYVVIEW